MLDNAETRHQVWGNHYIPLISFPSESHCQLHNQPFEHGSDRTLLGIKVGRGNLIGDKEHRWLPHFGECAYELVWIPHNSNKNMSL
jgi:hypothetical protein